VVPAPVTALTQAMGHPAVLGLLRILGPTHSSRLAELPQQIGRDDPRECRQNAPRYRTARAAGVADSLDGGKAAFRAAGRGMRRDSLFTIW
jgi:hypothetical protein